VNWRLVGIVLAAAGLVLLGISVLADPIGVGQENGFDGKQVVGTVVGAAVMVVGLALVYAPRRGEVEPGPEK
jgi:hypothetical protein